MSYNFQFFPYSSLNNYKFSVYDLKYPEQICGYDEQQRSWRGEELLVMREQGLIIKECPEKIVITEEKKALLGYIRECFDSTYLAHSCYYFGNLDILEVNGFGNEFYAVRYLHQVMNAAFSDTAYEPVPALPWQCEKDVQEQPKKSIFLEQLNALIGYVQECYKGIWTAYSCYYPKNMKAIIPVGFVSEFYAVRYLYQITELTFPHVIEYIPSLPWE